MQVCLGPGVKGAAPPFPDTRDTHTLIRGCLNRFCAANPEPDQTTLDELQEFVIDYVEKHYIPLVPGDVIDVHAWIDSTEHPQWRKREMHDAADSLEDEPLSEKDLHCNSFGKAETYPSYKHARGINSRTDRFKVHVGPFFSAIEKIVFSDEAFIKKVPYKDRARVLVENLGKYPGPYYETDYSHFESHFTEDMMNCLEMILYKHMLKNYPEVYQLIHDVLTGMNKCKFKGFDITIDGSRMSGEMCTSLGNGFSNLMLMKFQAYKKGGECYGFVEGDDGLFISSVEINTEDFRKTGFDIKMLIFDDIFQTSFCGLNASEDLCALANPTDVILNFGWTHSVMMHGGEKVMKGLLRAKAMSLLYQNPRCPVISVMALRYIALTEGIEARFDLGWWEQQMRKETSLYFHWAKSEADKGISDVARRAFWELYDISPAEQETLEGYFMTAGFGELDHPLLHSALKIHPDCYDYYNRFVTESKTFL